MYGLVRHSCPFHPSHELYAGQDERKGNKEIPWTMNSQEFLTHPPPFFSFFKPFLGLFFHYFVFFYFCIFFFFFLGMTWVLECNHFLCPCLGNVAFIQTVRLCKLYGFFFPHDLHAEMATNTDIYIYIYRETVYISVC